MPLGSRRRPSAASSPSDCQHSLGVFCLYPTSGLGIFAPHMSGISFLVSFVSRPLPLFCPSYLPPSLSPVSVCHSQPDGLPTGPLPSLPSFLLFIPRLTNVPRQRKRCLLDRLPGCRSRSLLEPHQIPSAPTPPSFHWSKKASLRLDLEPASAPASATASALSPKLTRDL